MLPTGALTVADPKALAQLEQAGQSAGIDEGGLRFDGQVPGIIRHLVARLTAEAADSLIRGDPTIKTTRLLLPGRRGVSLWGGQEVGEPETIGRGVVQPESLANLLGTASVAEPKAAAGSLAWQTGSECCWPAVSATSDGGNANDESTLG